VLGCRRDAASTCGRADSRERLSGFVCWRLLLRDCSADGGHGLELRNDRIIPSHQVLAIGQAVRPAIPRLDAADEVIGVGEPIEVLPRPERCADLRLRIELGGHRGHIDDRQPRQPLQRLIAAPARPLGATAANERRSIGRAGPVAHTGAVDVVEGMLLPPNGLPIFGDDRRRAFEPVRPDLRHPRGSIIDVLGQVRNGEPAALMLDIGEEERQTVAGGIDPRIGQHILFCHESIQNHLWRAREDSPHRLFSQLDGHLWLHKK
jgi:hypothetical protein